MKNAIQLKNVKFSEWNSEETNCFQAMVYFNGKRVGMASNEGRGGCTWVRPTDDIEDYRAFVAHLEATKEEDYYDTFTAIDDLFEEWLEAHYAKKDRARLEKNFEKGICYTKDESKGTFAIMTFKKGASKVTISQMLMSSNGRDTLRRSYDKLVSEGNKVLNNNLRFV